MEVEALHIKSFYQVASRNGGSLPLKAGSSRSRFRLSSQCAAALPGSAELRGVADRLLLPVGPKGNLLRLLVLRVLRHPRVQQIIPAGG